ncbi:hypothetical protein F4775DRAFT_598002 [Biscogniauxia sp. FL1348]|nr:hypothetical protein F4775DRAFT_598002 [Biscogniauxia sp. FL1348]
MSIDLRDLSHDDVVRLTKMLCRRPEYGIGMPSAKWLRRQEDKARQLPKHLLRPTNPIRRLVMRLADSVDPHLTDPQAVLCPTHAPLNPWLLRRAFMAVAYEVTVHSDALRSWGHGLARAPELAALVARLDAVNALWTPPALYRGFYGAAPFANHLVHVRSGCEACILAAVGANAQVLADLRAVVRDRRERRHHHHHHGRKNKGRSPRIERVVDAWIDHLGADRAALCRGWSDAALAHLRAARPDLAAWRSEQKRTHRGAGAGGKPVYTELRGGNRLSAVPADAPRKRRTRNGIPVALAVGADGDDAYHGAGAGDAHSVFRPDSECAGPASRVGGARDSGSGGEPTRSFIQRFEREMVIEDEDEYEEEEYDEYGEEEGVTEERDIEQEERSRTKVRDWYATRLEEKEDDHDAKTVLSAMHPAFQPYGAPSAVPEALDLGQGYQLRKDGAGDACTEATAYTVDASTAAAPPPVPRVPEQYLQPQEQELNWPAPPLTQQKKDRPARKYLFPDSEAGSCLSATQRRYLRERRGMRDFAPEDNPFTRRGESASEEKERGSRRSTSTISPTQQSASSSRSASRSGSRMSTPSLARSHGDTIQDEVYGDEEDEEDEDVYGGSVWGAGSEFDALRPDDSISNVYYAGQPQPPVQAQARSEVTSFGQFMRKAGGAGEGRK